MSNAAVTIDGIVRPDGSLEVHDKVRLSPGPVRVTVALAPDSSVQPSLIDVLVQFSQEQAASEPARGAEKRSMRS